MAKCFLAMEVAGWLAGWGETGSLAICQGVCLRSDTVRELLRGRLPGSH